MRPTSLILAPLLLCALALSTLQAASDPVEAFPAAEDGMKRVVFRMAKQPDESLIKVELIIGKTTTTDAANNHFFGGNIERVTLQGWGYSYFILRKLGPMAGTLMAPAPDAKNVEKFVPVRNPHGLLRYNSRMPLVVYVPEDVEVRCRLWQADEKATTLEEG